MRYQAGLLRLADVKNIETGRFVAGFRRLISDRQRIADDVQRIGTHAAMRQLGLHDDLRIARIADVHAAEIFRCRLMGEPQNAPSVRRQLHVYALAHATEAAEFVVREELHVPRHGFRRVRAF